MGIYEELVARGLIAQVTDEEKILYTKPYWDNDYSTFKKVRGCDNSYQTEDGKYFIRVVTQDKEWFSRHF